jgi:hypothetical protein
MKQLTVLAAVLIFVPIAAPTQTRALGAKSPKEVVEQFWAMEAAGGRLNPEGWYKAAAFFAVQPSPLPMEKDITVVAGDFRVADPTINGDQATVAVGCQGCRELGHLDSTLHLKLSPLRPARASARAMPGTSYRYDLVVSDKRWEIDPRTGAARELTGPRQWRLSSFQPTLILNVDTAIRYVTEMRAKWHDPAIRSNADAALAILQRWRR